MCDGAGGDPLPSLPQFTRLDPTGASSLNHLNWKIETSQVKEEREETPRGVSTRIVYPQHLQWDEISELHKVLTDANRGTVDTPRIGTTYRSAEDAPVVHRRDGPNLLCVNNDDDEVHVYASQNSLTRKLSFSAIVSGRSESICLPTGQIKATTLDNPDVVVCVTTAGKLLPEKHACSSPRHSDDEISEVMCDEAAETKEEEKISIEKEERLCIDFDVTKPLGMQLEYEKYRNRIVVHSIQPGYQAARAEGLRENMILVAIGDERVHNLDDFGGALLRLRDSTRLASLHFESSDAKNATEATIVRRREWRFETEDEERLAERTVPKAMGHENPAVARKAPSLDHFDDIPVGDSPFHVRIRNCRTFDTLRVTSTCGARSSKELARPKDLLPGGLYQAALRTTQQLFLIVGAAAETSSSPALVLQCGSAAVQSLYGYSVVWQSAARTLSCVAQSHLTAAPLKLGLEPCTLATKARVQVIEEVRALRARGDLDSRESSPPHGPAFQLTVI